MLFFLERNYSLNRVLYQIVLEILLNLDIFQNIHQDKQLRFESTKSTDAAILAEHKKKEREAAKHGKRPFYLKKCNVIVLFCFLPLCWHFSMFWGYWPMVILWFIITN